MVNWLMTTTAGKMVQTFCMSMLPVVELRAGLPYGIAQGLDYPLALVSAVLGNLLPVPFIVFFIEKIFAWMRKHMPRFNGFVSKMEAKAESKRDMIDKYGALGLIILVGIPLPGTGAWTGSLVAALLGMPPKKAFPCIFIGVIIAAAIMTAITYGVIHFV